MTAGQLLMTFTIGTAALALWSYVRWPGAAPVTMKGAVLRVAIALVLLQIGAVTLEVGIAAVSVPGDPGRGRRRDPGIDLRIPRVDLVPEGVRRPDPRPALGLGPPTRPG